ncbi:MAG: Holliday junction resolvase RecU [Bacilli bacterium]|nr:Holliday junction resolvase RecU [Bacilli bacterium]
MINYPSGMSTKKISKTTAVNKKVKAPAKFSTANRGMGLEGDINISNEYYKEKNLCLITKRPTPINVVKVDYSRGAIITNAYFEKQSTTDYNGVYKGRYIDFEAKSTKNSTSFPLANITPHQITHLKGVLHHGGIAFFVIEFVVHDEAYLLDASYVIEFYEHGDRKSIPYKDVKEKGHLIKKAYAPRLDYLPVVDEVYFK